MYSQPRLLQGIYPFTGQGWDTPVILSPALSYAVPVGKRAQLVYLRGGNAADELIALILMRDKTPMRYFPLGAKSDSHVALAVVEDLMAGTTLEAYVVAPAGVSGTVVVDIGLVEI